MARPPRRAGAAVPGSRARAGVRCPASPPPSHPPSPPPPPPLTPPNGCPRAAAAVVVSCAWEPRRRQGPAEREAGRQAASQARGRSRRSRRPPAPAAQLRLPAGVCDPFPPFPPRSPSPPPLPRAVPAGAAHAGGGAGRGGPRRRRCCRQGGGLKLNSHGLCGSRQLDKEEVIPWLQLREAVRYAWQ